MKVVMTALNGHPGTGRAQSHPPARPIFMFPEFFINLPARIHPLSDTQTPEMELFNKLAN